MATNWQRDAQQALKGAKQCNDFFQTQQFEQHNFPIKIPLEFANLINKNNASDPLLLQVLPALAPNGVDLGFSTEPLMDNDNSPVEGLIHKYPNRVLLIASRVCAIHCQYCFRQNFDYAQHDALSNWTMIEQYIVSDTKINEVILSGGDPLSLSDDKLQALITQIEKIPHIKTLRIHSRSAVVTPSRITDRFADMLERTTLNVVLVLHSNHANELSASFAKMIKKLQNITLLNQSVLLKDVNDSQQVLMQLSLRLFELGILPYYLHMLDKVQGAEHFLVSDECARELHQQLQRNLSGYLVPKLVRDNNGQSKDWLR